jgi:hypothetical protein
MTIQQQQQQQLFGGCIYTARQIWRKFSLFSSIFLTVVERRFKFLNDQQNIHPLYGKPTRGAQESYIYIYELGVRESSHRSIEPLPQPAVSSSPCMRKS